jgi:hypothetical protein
MRQLLLVSVTAVGIGTLMSTVFAQPANPPASVNNNNNYQARALPPGTRWPPWSSCPSC